MRVRRVDNSCLDHSTNFLLKFTFLIIFSYTIYYFQNIVSTKQEYAINLTLFKIIGFYQIFDPNSPELFGFNIYQLIYASIEIISIIMVFIGLSGMLIKVDGSHKYSLKEFLLVLFSIACNTNGSLRTVVTIYNASCLRNLFDVVRLSFLTNSHCKRNQKKLVECERSFKRTFVWYYLLFIVMAVVWITMPLLILINEDAEISKKTQNNNNRKCHQIELFCYRKNIHVLHDDLFCGRSYVFV